MSEQETVIGKFKELHKDSNLTIEEKCQKVCNEQKINLKDSEYCDTYEEIIMDDYSEKYFVYDDRLFEILKLHDFSYEDHCILEKHGDVFSFSASFYNGGTWLGEVLGEAVEEFENE